MDDHIVDKYAKANVKIKSILFSELNKKLHCMVLNEITYQAELELD